MAKLPGYMDGGIEQKYFIAKADGSRCDPLAHYFVLRFDRDPHARAALRAYAESVRDVNPQLARSILGSLASTAAAFRVRMIQLMAEDESGTDEE